MINITDMILTISIITVNSSLLHHC